MRVLAIDPSWAGKTGWAIGEDRELVGYGILEPARIMAHAIPMLASADALVIENQTYQYRVTTDRLLEAMGVWTHPAIHQYGIPVLRMPPSTWQSKVQKGWRPGKGSAKNIKEIQFYVEQRWGIREDRPDALSAICVLTVYMDTKRLEAMAVK